MSEENVYIGGTSIQIGQHGFINQPKEIIEYIKYLQKEIERLNKELEEKEAILGGIQQLEAEIERLKKDNEYLNKKHEKTIHNIMEFVDKNTFNHRNTGERILTLHGKGILDLFDICLGSDKE